MLVYWCQSVHVSYLLGSIMTPQFTPSSSWELLLGILHHQQCNEYIYTQPCENRQGKLFVYNLHTLEHTLQYSGTLITMPCSLIVPVGDITPKKKHLTGIYFSLRDGTQKFLNFSLPFDDTIDDANLVYQPSDTSSVDANLTGVVLSNNITNSDNCTIEHAIIDNHRWNITTNGESIESNSSVESNESIMSNKLTESNTHSTHNSEKSQVNTTHKKFYRGTTDMTTNGTNGIGGTTVDNPDPNGNKIQKHTVCYPGLCPMVRCTHKKYGSQRHCLLILGIHQTTTKMF